MGHQVVARGRQQRRQAAALGADLRVPLRQRHRLLRRRHAPRRTGRAVGRAGGGGRREAGRSSGYGGLHRAGRQDQREKEREESMTFDSQDGTPETVLLPPRQSLIKVAAAPKAAPPFGAAQSLAVTTAHDRTTTALHDRPSPRPRAGAAAAGRHDRIGANPPPDRRPSSWAADYPDAPTTARDSAHRGSAGQCREKRTIRRREPHPDRPQLALQHRDPMPQH